MQKGIKRIFDVVCAVLALLALAPVWLVVSLWVGLSSPGGIFFRQKRTGYKGAEFELLKFRSMYVNKEADTRQADNADPRITPVGRFLRQSSLDELPQLWNIIRGDMSIVGPRPHMIAHTDYYTPLIHDYMRRHDRLRANQRFPRSHTRPLRHAEPRHRRPRIHRPVLPVARHKNPRHYRLENADPQALTKESDS